jgi:hypothetical protein
LKEVSLLVKKTTRWKASELCILQSWEELGLEVLHALCS